MACFYFKGKKIGYIFDSSDILLPAYHSSNYLNFLYLMSQKKGPELN